MATFVYKARNNEGQAVQGQLEALDLQEAMLQLTKQQYIPISIDEVKQQGQGTSEAKSFLDINIDLGFLNKRKTKVKDVMVFCSNLSSMTSAGVPLLGAINIIAEQYQQSTMTETLRKVAQLISQGNSFSEALAKFPEVFSSFFVNMIRVGEMSGTIDNTLKALAIYLEKEENLRQTIRGIMIYPSILMFVGTAVVVLILTFLMPQFVAIFTKAKVELPLPTKIFYAISLFLRQYWIWCLVFIAALIAGIKFSLMKQQGRDFWDRLFIKVPIVGDLIIKTMSARLCRNLGIMLSSGVSLLVAINMAKQVLGNVVFRDIVQQVYESAEKGEGIHKALIPHKEVPKDVTYMISVGEQSGNLGDMLNKIADFYESKVQHEVKEAVTYIEPIFIVILGVVVGGIMASMILPLFDMVKTIQNVRG